MHPTARRIGVRAAATGSVLLGLVAALSVAPISSSAAPSSPENQAAEKQATERESDRKETGGVVAQQLPDSFEWSSTDPLISPADNINSVAAKDPSVVQDQDGTWHVLFTRVDTNGDWGLAQTSFDDWAQAGSAQQTDLESASAIGPGYRAAPHVFYFEPTGEWYLVYQDGLPAYSTTTNIDDPTSWSEPRHFMDSVPPIVEQNIGNGNWLDFFLPLVFTFSVPENRTLAVGMLAFEGTNSTDWSGLAAAASLSLLPILILFLVLQRYFVEGIAGAVKN